MLIWPTVVGPNHPRSFSVSEFSRKLVSPYSSTHSSLWHIQVATLKWVKKHTIIPVPRPVEDEDDPFRLVSEATRLWIKGWNFSVARLLGDAYKGKAEKYNGGALAIFRLAPQDYHRFRSPVDGR
jgi:phosphatidylserine decarboxylase